MPAIEKKLKDCPPGASFMERQFEFVWENNPDITKRIQAEVEALLGPETWLYGMSLTIKTADIVSLEPEKGGEG